MPNFSERKKILEIFTMIKMDYEKNVLSFFLDKNEVFSVSMTSTKYKRMVMLS